MRNDVWSDSVQHVNMSDFGIMNIKTRFEKSRNSLDRSLLREDFKIIFVVFVYTLEEGEKWTEVLRMEVLIHSCVRDDSFCHSLKVFIKGW